MQFVIILTGIALLILLISVKLNPAIALLITSLVTGLMLSMPFAKVMASINGGIGGTLSSATGGSLIMVLALGGMFGKVIEDSGVAQKIVSELTSRFKNKNIQWAILATGLLIGIPLFYNAGFVILIPLVFAIAASTRLPLLYVGIPMVAPLSVTHGFLPPHPGPVTLISIFSASFGKTLMYGMLLSIPIAMIAGVLFTRLIIKPVLRVEEAQGELVKEEGKILPSAGKSFLVAVLPVLLITLGTIVPKTGDAVSQAVFGLLKDPTMALLLSLLITILLLRLPIVKAMDMCAGGVKAIAMIILIIAAGGAFKQILVDSGVGSLIAAKSEVWNLSPLFLAWAITALLRVAMGSATVSAVTASGIMLPFMKMGVSPELMVLAIGAGSLMGSHVNDTGFWMFKEYFGLTLKQTFATWTLMESIISLLGLAGVLLLALFI